MLTDAPPTLLNTIMHNKHLSHLVAKSMNELAHKSPLIVCILPNENCSLKTKLVHHVVHRLTSQGQLILSSTEHGKHQKRI